MTLKAPKDLLTGIATIDAQHAELFKRVNLLYQACMDKHGREEVLNTMDYLEYHLKVHMHEEEHYMIKNSYPSYLEHRASHSQFLDIYKGLVEKYNAEGSSAEFITTINKSLRNWILTHIQNEDLKLATFLKTIEKE